MNFNADLEANIFAIPRPQRHSHQSFPLGRTSSVMSHGSDYVYRPRTGSIDVNGHTRMHKKPVNMSGCKNFLKYAIISFSALLFIVGVALLGAGIYILVSEFGAQQLTDIMGNDLYHVVAHVSISWGAAIVLISICGCCGACWEKKIFLGCYMFMLVVLLLLLVAATVLVFVFLDQMSEDVKGSMKDVLISKYGVEDSDPQNRIVTDMWNFLQKELMCCGVTGGENATTSWAVYKLSSTWFQQQKSDTPRYVPESCCHPEGDIGICTGTKPFIGPPTIGPLNKTGEGTMTFSRNPNLFVQGCYDELVHFVENHTLVLGAISLTALIIILFGILFVICMCKKMRYYYYS